jgi:hypothetical protein
MIGAVETWFVIFQRRAIFVRWANWIPGEFKHVLALGARTDGVWVIASAGILERGFIFLPEAMLGPEVERLLDGAVVMQMGGCSAPQPKGWWCTRLVVNLIGLPSCALRPDALFRECLRHGGRIVIGEPHGRHLWPDRSAEDGRERAEAGIASIASGEDRLASERHRPAYPRPDPQIRDRSDELKWPMSRLLRRKPSIGFSVPARQRH